MLSRLKTITQPQNSTSGTEAAKEVVQMNWAIMAQLRWINSPFSRVKKVHNPE